MEGRRAGGRCCRIKKLNFLRADELHRRACCTTGRASGLHSKLVYRKGRAGGLPFSAARPVLFRSPPDRLLVQPDDPPFCLLCSPPKVHVFHLETRPSSPPGPPALQLVLSQTRTFRQGTHSNNCDVTHIRLSVLHFVVSQQCLSIIAKQFCYEVKFTCKAMLHGPNIAQAFTFN